jgi:aminopeptidase N
MRQQLANGLRHDWEWAYESYKDNGAYRPDAVSSGRRALAGLALTHLCLAAAASGDPVWPDKALQRFKDAGNMTDRFHALTALVVSGHPLAGAALERFHALFKHEDLVLDKWFALQAGAPDRGGQVLPLVRQLMTHPDFHLRNPNRARSLIFSFCSANPGAFHRNDAAGYVFWAERVMELDAINPQVAARLLEAGFLSRFHPLLSARLAAMTHPIGAATLGLMVGGGLAAAPPIGGSIARGGQAGRSPFRPHGGSRRRAGPGRAARARQ